MPDNAPSKEATDRSTMGAAKRIFDVLPAESGEGEVEDYSGSDREREPEPTGEDEGDEAGDGFDDEAAAALRGESEDNESVDDESDEESDADDEEEPEDSEGDEDEETYEETDEDELFTVKVDGQEERRTLRELKEGFSRTAVWTRRMQALAKEREEFAGTREQITQERAQLADRLAAVETLLRSQMPNEPTSDDPREWVRYQKEMQRLEQVAAERQRIQQRLMEDQQAERDALVEAENARLTEIIPEWEDDGVARAEKADLAKYAIGLGFDPEDVEAIADHRVVLLLRKAREYDRLEEEKRKVKGKKKTSGTMKPGRASRKSSRSKKRSKKLRSGRDRLRETGNVKDAAALIHDMLPED